MFAVFSCVAIEYADTLISTDRAYFATAFRMATHGALLLSLLGIVYQPTRRRFWYGFGISLWWYLLAISHAWVQGPARMIGNYDGTARVVADYLWVLFAAFHIGLVNERIVAMLSEYLQLETRWSDPQTKPDVY